MALWAQPPADFVNAMLSHYPALSAINPGVPGWNLSGRFNGSNGCQIQYWPDSQRTDLQPLAALKPRKKRKVVETTVADSNVNATELQDLEKIEEQLNKQDERKPWADRLKLISAGCKAPNNEGPRPPSSEQRQNQSAISLQEQMGVPLEGQHTAAEPAQHMSSLHNGQQFAGSQPAGPADLALLRDAVMQWSRAHRLQRPPQPPPVLPLSHAEQEDLHRALRILQGQAQPAPLVQQNMQQNVWEAIYRHMLMQGMPLPIDPSTRMLSQSVPGVRQDQMRPRSLARSLSQGLPESGNASPQQANLVSINGSAFKRVIPRKRQPPGTD